MGNKHAKTCASESNLSVPPQCKSMTACADNDARCVQKLQSQSQPNRQLKIQSMPLEQQPTRLTDNTSTKTHARAHRPNIIRIISVKKPKVSSPSRSMSNSPCSALSACNKPTFLQVDKPTPAGHLVPSPSTSPRHTAVYVPLNGNNLELPQTYSPRPPPSFSSIHLMASTPDKLSISRSRSEWSSMSNPYSTKEEDDDDDEVHAPQEHELDAAQMHEAQESQSESNWMMYTHIPMNKPKKIRSDLEHVHMELPNTNGIGNVSLVVTSPSPSPSPSPMMLETYSVQLFVTGDERRNNIKRSGQSPHLAIAQSSTSVAQFGDDGKHRVAKMAHLSSI